MTLRGSPTSESMRAWRRYFPLTSVTDVVDLLRDMIQTTLPTNSTPAHYLTSKCKSDVESVSLHCEPNLAFISIIIGYIENQLTLGLLPDPLVQKKAKPPLAFAQVSKRTQAKKRPYDEASSQAKRMQLPTPSPPATLGSTLNSLESRQFPCANSSLSSVDTNIAPCESASPLPPRGRYSDIKPLTELKQTEGSDQSQVDSSGSHFSDKRIPLHPFVATTAKLNCENNAPTLTADCPTFPTLRFEEAEQLYQNFYSLFMKNSKLTEFNKSTVSNGSGRYPINATRDLIRAICNLLWARLSTKRYCERVAHAQSIYSFLTVGILDSFGLAYATVSACQLLGYSDVQLALSEDHAWVEFGPADRRETADVAVLDGQQSEAFAGTALTTASSVAQCFASAPSDCPPLPIRQNHLARSWLYLNGHPVICSPPAVSVAAAVTAIQPCGILVAPPTATGETHSNTPRSSGKRHRMRRPSEVGRSNLASRGTGSTLRGHSPSSANVVSLQLIELKRHLLWMVYKAGLLSHYPLGLTNLADLEELYPSNTNHLETLVCNPPVLISASVESSDASFTTHQAPLIANENDIFPMMTSRNRRWSPTQNTVSLTLLYQAVDVSRRFYTNLHVYPYIYLAGYMHRRGNLQAALKYWAEAARVIGQFNHSSEDAEIYRELLEVATHLMPAMLKAVADGYRTACLPSLAHDPVTEELYCPHSVLDDPQCLAHLLTFYDHLCLWEEGSIVPVLHVGWVDKLMVSLSRFSAYARHHLALEADDSAMQPSHCTPTRPERKTAAQLMAQSLVTQQVTSATQPLTVILPATAASPTLQAPLSVTSCASSSTAASAAAAAALSLLVPDEASEPIVNHFPSQLNDRMSSAAPLLGRALRRTEVAPASAPAATRLCVAETMNSPVLSVVNRTTALTTRDVAGVNDELVGLTDLSLPLSISLDNAELEAIYLDRTSKESILASLATICDRRLLNPSFLLGVDLQRPFQHAGLAIPDEGNCEDEGFPVLTFNRCPSQASLDNFVGLTNAVDGKASPKKMFESPRSTIGVDDDDKSLLLSGGSPRDSVSYVCSRFNRRDSADEVSRLLASSLSQPAYSQPQSADDNFLDMEALLMSEVAEVLSGTTEVEQSNIAPSLPVDALLGRVPTTELQEEVAVEQFSSETKLAHLRLLSVKMCSIAQLLRAPGRLNASAIKLALTAQSQVCPRRRSSTVIGGLSHSPAGNCLTPSAIYMVGQKRSLWLAPATG